MRMQRQIPSRNPSAQPKETTTEMVEARMVPMEKMVSIVTTMFAVEINAMPRAIPRHINVASRKLSFIFSTVSNHLQAPRSVCHPFLTPAGAVLSSS